MIEVGRELLIDLLKVSEVQIQIASICGYLSVRKKIRGQPL